MSSGGQKNIISKNEIIDEHKIGLALKIVIIRHRVVFHAHLAFCEMLILDPVFTSSEKIWTVLRCFSLWYFASLLKLFYSSLFLLPLLFYCLKHQADAFRCFMRGKCEGSSSYFFLSYRLPCAACGRSFVLSTILSARTEEVINESPATLPALFKIHISSSFLLMPSILASPAYFISVCASVLS